MRNSRRTSIEIIAEILKLGKAGVGKTHVMYNVNMSHTQLERYISFLVERGFLQPAQSPNLVKYHTTAKGKELLNDIDRLTAVLRLESEPVDTSKPPKPEGKV
jgi:predicted transcriptional regulator